MRHQRRNAAHPRRIRFAIRYSTTSPTTSSAAAIAAATIGASATSVATPVTATSPVTEAATFVIGSGEVLIANRTPALVRWLTRAVMPPTDANSTVHRSPVAPAISAPNVAPAIGRITVPIVSHAESM